MFLTLMFPLLLVLTVSLHYAFLKWLTGLFRSNLHQAVKLVSIVSCLFIAHLIEIMIYALVYYISARLPDFGGLQSGSFTQDLNALYFSFIAYSSLGTSDLVPTGWVRILYGLEALNGLLLITWSASFTFLAMNKMWDCGDCVKTTDKNIAPVS
jgi:hypothetical protein